MGRRHSHTDARPWARVCRKLRRSLELFFILVIWGAESLVEREESLEEERVRFRPCGLGVRRLRVINKSSQRLGDAWRGMTHAEHLDVRRCGRVMDVGIAV